jgi:hypothetical protein
MARSTNLWRYIGFSLLVFFVTFQLHAQGPSGIISDDFNADTLSSIWTYVNPLGDVTLNLTGTHAVLELPEGTKHDAWTDGNTVPRLMQNANNTNFEIEAKLDVNFTQKIQDHGIMVEETTSRYLRFDILFDGVNYRAFAGLLDGGTYTIFADLYMTIAGPMWLRVTRISNTWTYQYSENGTNWTPVVTFNQALTVSRVGVYGANVGLSGAPPAHTLAIDYFFNTAFPIDPEDGNSTDADPPVITAISANPSVVSANIAWLTDEYATSRVDYGTTTSYGNNVQMLGLTTGHNVLVTGLIPNTTYYYKVTSADGSGNAAEQVGGSFTTLPDSDPPVITIWHGTSQAVGHLGYQQHDFNVLGNASDLSGISSLSYTLNGGSAVALTVGPDGRRLDDVGDFNADIPLTSLQSGINNIVIYATDGSGNNASRSMTVNYLSGSYPLPTYIDWSALSSVQSAIQYVDGLWGKDGGNLRTQQIGYDRIVLIGDTAWQDYEISCPVTINGLEEPGPLSGGAGLGFYMRFTGYIVGGFRNFPDVQPKWGYQPAGGIGWLRWENGTDQAPFIQFYPGDSDNANNSAGQFPITVGSTYNMKMRCETLDDAPDGDGVTRYSFKIWQGSNEPANWNFSIVQESQYALRKGGVGLLSHHVDASFGDVTVIRLNNPPIITSDPVTEADQNELYEYQVTVDDPDVGDKHTFTLEVAPHWLSVNDSTGLISGTPGQEDIGDTTVTVKVTDSGDESDSQTYDLTVIDVNDPPVITSTPDSIATQGELYQYQVVAVDLDEDVLTYSLTVKPAWLSIDENTGLISGTPTNADVGDHPVTVMVDDNNGGTDTQSYTLRVINTNDPPTITSTPVTTAKQGQMYQYQVTATDPDQDVLAYKLEVAPKWLSINASSGLISGVPANEDVGDTTVTVLVDDSKGGTDTQTYDLNVENTNDPPVITSTPVTTGLEGSLYEYQVEADDPDGDDLTYTLSIKPTWLSINSTTGLIRGTPHGPNVGDTTVSVLVYDGNGGADVQDYTLTVQKSTGIFDMYTNQIPDRFILLQNHPNPFNPTTKIRFGLPQAAEVRVEVYNILGEKMATVWNGYLSSGYHSVDFNAANLPSGVYIYQLQAEGFVEVKRMILMK